VAASLALFLSITAGTAWAVDEWTGANIQDGTLTTVDYANNDIRGADIRNGTLGTTEFSKTIPAAHVTHSAIQNVPYTNPSITTLAFDTERYDTAGMHSTTTNNSRLTAPVNGIYVVTAQVRWEFPVPAQSISLALRENGTTYIAWEDGDAQVSYQEVSTQVQLAAGDYVEVLVEQASQNQSTLGIAHIDQVSPEFAMTWLAPGR
jgi:hypothetical protein